MHTQNLIIGFGKAGKTLAADLANHGQSVVLVEQNDQMYGGTCINIGCIPSKKLLVEGAKQHDFQAAMQAKHNLIPKLRAANFAKLDNMANVQVIHAQAQFQDEHTVILRSAQGEQTIHAERIFINTGATSNPLNVAGADHPRVHYSTEMLSLAERPERLVIIGGGYISLEFAFMYQQFGSQVTILDNSPVFLPREDRDIAEEMLRVLNSRQINVVQSIAINAFAEQGDGVVVQTNQGEFAADAVLVAIGRQPNTAALALQNAGIATTERGFIATDAQCRVIGKEHITALCATNCLATARAAATTAPPSPPPPSPSRRCRTSA